MRLTTPADIGATIRSRRQDLGMDQSTLAVKVGATRQWIIAVEQGHPRAALGLVLRTLQALNMSLEALPERGTTPARNTPDIDAIVNAAKKRGR